MLSRRFFAAFFISALLVSSASAQFVHTSVTTHPRAVQHALNAPPTVQSALPFEVIQADTNQVQVSTNNPLAFTSTVLNQSSTPISVYFKRPQPLVPCGWNSSVCWGTSCYSDSTDSVTLSSPLAPGASASLILDVDPGLGDVPDSATIWMWVGIAGSTTDTVMLPFHVSFIPANPPIVFQWSSITGNATFDSTFVGAGTHTLSNLLTNGLCHGADYNFTIQDSLLPQGWTLSTCVQNSYLDTCTSGTALQSNFSDYGDSTYLQRVNFTLHVPALTAPDSAVVYFGVHPATSNPADSEAYRFAIVVQPTPSGVANAPDDRAGLVVTNAWPNPLHPSSTLHLEVLTDEQGPASARIFDLDGTLKATHDLGQLSVGSNELQAALPDLPSGEYIIRVGQGTSASEVVRINYIK